MICLAEAVESAQGNTTDTEVLTARAAGVVSYGNRLHCSWERSNAQRPRAKFSWGNSRTYRPVFPKTTERFWRAQVVSAPS